MARISYQCLAKSKRQYSKWCVREDQLLELPVIEAMIVPKWLWCYCYSLASAVTWRARAAARSASGRALRAAFRRGPRSRDDPSPRSPTRMRVGVGTDDPCPTRRDRGQRRPMTRRTRTSGRPPRGPPRTLRPYVGRSRRGRAT